MADEMDLPIGETRVITTTLTPAEQAILARGGTVLLVAAQPGTFLRVWPDGRVERLAVVRLDDHGEPC